MINLLILLNKSIAARSNLWKYVQLCSKNRRPYFIKTFFAGGICLFSMVVKAQDTITVFHQRYSVTFDRTLLYPVRVHWILNSSDICNTSSSLHVSRTNYFTSDPLLPLYTKLKRDYQIGSKKYDKGHNMDAADNSCSLIQMHECFYFSNITPQTKRLNEQTWRQLEIHTRKLAFKYGRVEIWCGSYGAIEKVGRVTAPEYCWKIVKYKNKTEAYILPNADSVNHHSYKFYKSCIKLILTASHLQPSTLPH